MKLFPVFISGILLIAGIVVTGCSEEKIKPNIMQISQGPMPTQDSRNDRILLTDEGILRAIVYANRVRMYENKNETLLDTLRIEFFNEQHQRTSVLTARRGRIDHFSNNMYAMDSVVARNDSGTVMRTEELMWRHVDRKIVSEKYVRITSKTEDLQGYGVVADQNLQNYVVSKPTIVTTSASFADTTR